MTDGDSEIRAGNHAFDALDEVPIQRAKRGDVETCNGVGLAPGKDSKDRDERRFRLP